MSLYEKEKPEFLVLSVDSMLNQTVMPNEIVIVKDGPLPDELNAIIDKYKQAFPDIFTIVTNEKNLGLGLSLNNGLRVARNNLIARMDTDDVSLNNRCEKQLAIFEAQPELSIVGSWVDEFDFITNKKISTRCVPENNEQIYKFAKRRSSFNHPVVMYRKDKVLENNGYSNLRRNQDVDLFGRMLFAGCKAYNIQESLLLFRTDINLAKRRKSFENTKSYVSTIKHFWKMGYSSFWDYFVVSLTQYTMFLLPAKFQIWIYKTFLRKKGKI